MTIDVTRIDVNEILPLRELHRHEMHCQIVHDSFPRRGLSDPYLIEIADQRVGYGFVANKYDRNAVDEFYVAPAYRRAALDCFRTLLEVSQATRIRAQTNDPLLLAMLYDCGTNITSDTVLFGDAFTSHLTCASVTLTRKPATDAEEWQLEANGDVVASGGLLFHYNPPYGDVFMEVVPAHRQQGLGSYLVQELKRICYGLGKVPAARCSATNVASRKTLEKAGMLVIGRVLMGDVAR
jgi:GNAT superfamily N-acetyltransferase